ncbi:hypothetical protein [Candidatus Regiella endosymbiont of Tuberolachnus salignus]|uniref:hypothetical protein n=1 Tax=Candidatus Regiella endosymbiont of Tuberolachnus salignus TaxID=3077956 RepID=UPI0030CEB215
MMKDKNHTAFSLWLNKVAMSIPFAFEVAFGCQGDRPMSVDRLRDSASTRSQQRGGFKGERYRAGVLGGTQDTGQFYLTTTNLKGEGCNTIKIKLIIALIAESF